MLPSLAFGRPVGSSPPAGFGAGHAIIALLITSHGYRLQKFVEPAERPISRQKPNAYTCADRQSEALAHTCNMAIGDIRKVAPARRSQLPSLLPHRHRCHFDLRALRDGSHVVGLCVRLKAKYKIMKYTNRDRDMVFESIAKKLCSASRLCIRPTSRCLVCLPTNRRSEEVI